MARIASVVSAVHDDAAAAEPPVAGGLAAIIHSVIEIVNDASRSKQRGQLDEDVEGD